MSLAATLPHAFQMAEAGRQSSSREVRLAADMLTPAVESLALRLDREYLKTGSAVEEVLSSYAADHGFDPPA
jgi:hypothetical protein